MPTTARTARLLTGAALAAASLGLAAAGTSPVLARELGSPAAGPAAVGPTAAGPGSAAAATPACDTDTSATGDASSAPDDDLGTTVGPGTPAGGAAGQLDVPQDTGSVAAPTGVPCDDGEPADGALTDAAAGGVVLDPSEPASVGPEAQQKPGPSQDPGQADAPGQLPQQEYPGTSSPYPGHSQKPAHSAEPGYPAGPDEPVGPPPGIPHGHLNTGAGGSVHVDVPKVAVGSAVLAGSAVGGVWLLRRRASGTQS
jgi:hypothetical protein